MTADPLIYHGTPLTPARAFDELAGRAFCVSFARPDSVAHAERVGAWIMYDCGEFKFYRDAKAQKGARLVRNWADYYRWLAPRLFHPGRWAVIPDMIDGGVARQDQLLRDWPFGHRGAPVWHTDEPIARLQRLLDEWPRVCIGSAGLHWKIGSDSWIDVMDEAFDMIASRHPRAVIHMLRGLAVARWYPFASADATSLAQNLHRYRAPLFAGTPDEFRHVAAYADRLERLGQ